MAEPPAGRFGVLPLTVPSCNGQLFNLRLTIRKFGPAKKKGPGYRRGLFIFHIEHLRQAKKFASTLVVEALHHSSTQDAYLSTVYA
jgi:hypothetical protein